MNCTDESQKHEKPKKIDKLNFSKTIKQAKEQSYNNNKKNCATQDLINKVKRYPAEWEKILGNNLPVKVLLFRINKEPLQHNNTETNMGKKFNRNFSKEICRLTIST